MGSRRRAAAAPTHHANGEANGVGHHTGSSHLMKLPTMPRVEEDPIPNGTANGNASV